MGEPENHALGRSQGGFETKLHVIVDGHGVPLGHHLTPGQANEGKSVAPVLESIALPHAGRGRRRKRPHKLAGDKGYSFPYIRRYLQKRGIIPVIPHKSNQQDGRGRFDKVAYRNRNIVERCIGWLKENRRLGTRFEKLALTFGAFVQLAMIRRCFRILELINTA